MKRTLYISLLLLWCAVGRITAQASDRIYRLEIGIHGGCCYYVGDANRRIFNDIREAYGASFRYMFDRRWAVSVNGMQEHITGYLPNGTGFADKQSGSWHNRLINFDVAGEFNFLPFGDVKYDSRIKPVTPYIALGAGVCLHSGWKKAAAYIPLTVGMKWRAARHLTIHLAWEHNVYISDAMENVVPYNNSYNLNGGNIMNLDVTGSLVAGVAIAFVQDRKVCRTCK